MRLQQAGEADMIRQGPGVWLRQEDKSPESHQLLGCGDL